MNSGLDKNDCGPYCAPGCRFCIFLAEIQIFIMGQKDLLIFEKSKICYDPGATSGHVLPEKLSISGPLKGAGSSFSSLSVRNFKDTTSTKCFCWLIFS